MKTRGFVLFVSVVCLALAAAGSLSVRASQAHDLAPEPARQAFALGEMPLDQIIIKYKDSADVTGLNAPDGLNRMKTLSAAAGVELQYFRPMSGDAHVLRLPGKLPVAEVERIAQKLAALPDVEYADPDYIRRITLTPNDTQYASQWHYFEQYGINAPTAWDITTGSSTTVVAVIDTGYRPHADLTGRFVSGYDFVSNPFVANDGGGRDNDASDPGDWIAANECGFPHSAEDSSWHGTHVAGTIGANSNNSVGVASVNWNARILPIRVLGKCGGTDSDIIDGMKWAAGLSVPGVSNNLNPAKVLNLSLGGSGACTSSWQTAITSITGAGATVIVAAGNDSLNASGFVPANCNGVISVAATDRGGNMAWYSNFGSVVEISAPGGETNTSPAPTNGVLSTLNAGTTTPGADSYEYYQGTSMATPHVVGVASLLYGLSPSLTPAQVGRILTSTVTAFPGGSSCSTSICGAGIVNAGAAVAVLPRITSTSPISAATGGPTFTLTVNGANFVNGAVVQWNGSDRATRFVNSTQLTATIPAADITLSDAVNVTVRLTHPTYGSLTTAAKTFNVSGPTDTFVYLPLVAKRWPSPPDAPVLNAIDNADGDGNYTVSWGSAYLANTYTLQEDDNSSFSSPTTVYGPGTGLSWAATGKATGTYYYRARATNTYGDSPWSGTQSVTVLPPQSGPTPGFWQSTNTAHEFYVTTDRQYVDRYAIYVSVTGCGNYKITHISPRPAIVNMSFSQSGSFYFSGTFDTSTAAHGSDGLSSYYIFGCGYVTGGPFNWTANWKNSSQPSITTGTVTSPDGETHAVLITVIRTFEPAGLVDNR